MFSSSCYNCAKYKILGVFPTASPLHKHAWSTLIDGTVFRPRKRILVSYNLQLFIFSAFKPTISQSAPGALYRQHNTQDVVVCLVIRTYQEDMLLQACAVDLTKYMNEFMTSLSVASSPGGRNDCLVHTVLHMRLISEESRKIVYSCSRPQNGGTEGVLVGVFLLLSHTYSYFFTT